MRNHLVREVMSQPTIAILWSATILEAAAVMETNRVRRLPVIDENQVVIGIISQGDVREATSVFHTASPYAPDQDEVLLCVDEVMASEVKAVGPDDSLMTVVQLMMEHKIGGVPVLDEQGRALGIVTESDIFRLLIQSWQAAGAQ